MVPPKLEHVREYGVGVLEDLCVEVVPWEVVLWVPWVVWLRLRWEVPPVWLQLEPLLWLVVVWPPCEGTTCGKSIIADSHWSGIFLSWFR